MTLQSTPSDSQARAALEARQRELLGALRGGPLPAGFDSAAVQRCGQSLIRKRTREAARALPAHARWLDRHWVLEFTRYATANSAPGRGGPLADGLDFIRWLRAEELMKGPPPRPVKIERFFAALRWRTTHDGAVPRSGPRLRIAFFAQSPRVLIAMRYTSQRWLFERHWWL